MVLNRSLCYDIFAWTCVRDPNSLMTVQRTVTLEKYLPNLTFLYLDINECDVDKGGCNQICVNKAGSYECNCHSGYIMGSDRKTCSGIMSPFSDISIWPPCNISYQGI